MPRYIGRCKDGSMGDLERYPERYIWPTDCVWKRRKMNEQQCACVCVVVRRWGEWRLTFVYDFPAGPMTGEAKFSRSAKFPPQWCSPDPRELFLSCGVFKRKQERAIRVLQKNPHCRKVEVACTSRVWRNSNNNQWSWLVDRVTKKTNNNHQSPACFVW